MSNPTNAPLARAHLQLDLSRPSITLPKLRKSIPSIVHTHSLYVAVLMGERLVNNRLARCCCRSTICSQLRSALSQRPALGRNLSPGEESASLRLAVNHLWLASCSRSRRPLANAPLLAACELQTTLHILNHIFAGSHLSAGEYPWALRHVLGRWYPTAWIPLSHFYTFPPRSASFLRIHADYPAGGGRYSL